MIGLIGKKIGMTYIYDNFNFYTPVTIINIYNCYIFNYFKNLKYFYFILSYFYSSYFKNSYFLKQFKVSCFDYNNFMFYNKNIPLNVFYINQKINVFGITKGKGFSGVIKRYGFSSGDSSHGNSKAHKKPGSIGMCQDPGRVYPGKKLPGHLGNKKIVSKNLYILRIDFNNNIFYLKGSVAGFNNSNIIISPNLK